MGFTAVGGHGIGNRGHDGTFWHDVVSLCPNELSSKHRLITLILVLSPMCLGADVGDGIARVPIDYLVAIYCGTGHVAHTVIISYAGIDYLGYLAAGSTALHGLLEIFSLLASKEGESCK